ncbi:hypothetical protein RO3G_09757 [Rhizopus delemar RA 99-880]|uniref:Replication protein A subunit n=1 Tax=Rhizopus delemar (strain RA 99-880 / ATCC MYA-4621 / FGSC 9543 / NRRL 43880) TaxID=246409 RepID=I1C9B7_RHIO9|nr:hypothetical protein RO3G_09757 [Rhizopus delemar RA 99-880]|eukprot:EIE85047.1 hypothetical protein RO3G_09757 [Rhizopus delemar RA 99-880]
MSQLLSSGAIEAIYFDEVTNPLTKDPILQLINFRVVLLNGHVRYKAIVSDGIHFIPGWLYVCLGVLIENGQIKKNSIVRVKEYSCNLISNKKWMLIQKVDFLSTDVQEKVGKPISIELGSASTMITNVQQWRLKRRDPPECQFQREMCIFESKTSASDITRASMPLPDLPITPIKHLNPYQHIGTTIEVKELCLALISLIKVYGEIKATAFNGQCAIDSAIPQTNFSFVKIIDLEKTEKDETVENNLTGWQINKRSLLIIDDTEHPIQLTVWGSVAEEFDSNNTPIIACKGLRVNEYNGRSLSLPTFGTLTKNPSIPEAHHLYQWFSFKKQNIQQLISLKSLKGEKDNIPWINLVQLYNGHLNTSYTLDYFMFRGTISYIKHDTIAYPGCPTCAKKLQQKESSWECEQCKKILSVPNWRYVLFAGISDFSGQAFFTIFDNVAVHIIGMTAAELLKIADRSMEIFQKEFTKALFKTYNFKARAKAVQYNVSWLIKEFIPFY